MPDITGVVATATLSATAGDLVTFRYITGPAATLTLSAPAGGVWIPPVISTPQPSRPRYIAPVYSFLLFDPSTGAVVEDLNDATDASVSLNLKDSSSASFSLAFDSPNTPLIKPLSTGLLVYRNDFCVFAGLVGPGEGNIDSSSHKVKYVAVDYRGVLKRRRLYLEDPIVRTGLTSDAEDLGWQMIKTVQQRENGSMHIVRGYNGAVGEAQFFKSDAGDSVFDAIQKLAGSSPGFDWDIVYDSDGRLVYEVWLTRGDIVTFPFDLGGSVRSMRYNFAPENYGNAVRVLGSGGIQSNAMATDLEASMRLEVVESDDSIKTQGQADSRARGLLKTSKDLTPTYSVDLASALWSPELLWLGDQSRIDILPGRNDPVRVTAVSLGISPGAETVSVTLGKPVVGVLQKIAMTYDRVARAESQVIQKPKTFISDTEPTDAVPGDFWTTSS